MIADDLNVSLVEVKSPDQEYGRSRISVILTAVRSHVKVLRTFRLCFVPRKKEEVVVEAWNDDPGLF
jgi:hypothetical protein